MVISLLGAIDSNRINSVIYIASLCPYAYGKGVYQARSELTRLGIDTLEYDDQANCAQLGYFRKANIGFEKNIQTPMFYVTPNPIKDNATFYFDKDAIGGTISIKDVFGKTLFSTKINSNQNNFHCSLEDFTSGIYFVNLVINESVLTTIKLIIIK